MNLYITEHGARISLKGNRLVVETSDEKKEIPIGLIESLTINKTVQITSQAICQLSEEGVETAWFSKNKMICRTFGNENVLRQKSQFDSLNDKEFLLKLSKKNITAKIINQLEFAGIANCFNISDVKKCESTDELLGVEGRYAALYFSEIKKLIPDKCGFKGRNKDNPDDIVNCLMNYCYTLLYNKFTEAISVHGLNASVGFTHCLKNGHYALSSDMMESLRSIICDSVVLQTIEEGVSENDFVPIDNGEHALSKDIRKRLIENYTKRLETEVDTPNGYSNDFSGVIDNIVCTYIKSIEQMNEGLYMPFRKENYAF